MGKVAAHGLVIGRESACEGWIARRSFQMESDLPVGEANRIQRNARCILRWNGDRTYPAIWPLVQIDFHGESLVGQLDRAAPVAARAVLCANE